MSQQGSRLLFVSSILMLIGAAFSILGFLSIFLFASLLGGGAGAVLTLVFIFVGLVGTVLQFISGILGTKHWKTPAKANTCLLWGGITLAFTLANNIYNVYTTFAAGGNIFALITSLLSGVLVPVFYLLGAAQLKKMAPGA